MRTMLIFASLFAETFGASLFAAPQDQTPKPSIEQQLRKQYAVSRLGINGVVTLAGTVLVVQQDNIKSNPADRQLYWANTYKKGGRVKQPFLGEVNFAPMKDVARLLQIGEKAYLSKLEIKPTEVVFSIQSCGACNPAAVDPNDPPFRASIAFQFAKGDLATGDFKEIQETIGQVFGIDTPATAAPPSPIAPPSQPSQPDLTPAVQAQQQAEPPTITLGQTRDQVAAALGQPDRVAKVGNKEICIYKDMKITFVDGKVSDIQ